MPRKGSLEQTKRRHNLDGGEEMAIRKILIVLATALVLIGLSQVVFAQWWIKHLPNWIESPSFYVWGIWPLLFGVLLLLGVLEHAVGYREILAIVSILSIAGGILMLVQPQFVRDIAYAVFLNRSHSIRVVDLWVGGFARIAIGAVIILGLIRPAYPARKMIPTVENGEPTEQ